jgi:hypothetical protein
MSSVVGRQTDALRTQDGTYLPAWLFDYIIRDVNRHGGGVRAFRVVQEAFHRFRVEVVTGSGFEGRAMGHLRAALRRHLGEEIQLEFRQVEEIPRERSGKLRYFVPLLDAESEPAHPPLLEAS